MSANTFLRPACEVVDTPISGLLLLQRFRIDDDRGFLSRVFAADDAGGHVGKRIVQVNHTLTRRRGAVRGMHFQLPPYADTRVVTCLHGEVFDVAIDLRRGSPTFLQWHAEVLSPANQRSLIVPEGFAHGFQALTADCEMLYLHTAPYAPDSESAVHVQDPRAGIDWPLPIAELSLRDQRHPWLDAGFAGLDV